jgi:hypothetical protein
MSRDKEKSRWRSHRSRVKDRKGYYLVGVVAYYIQRDDLSGSAQSKVTTHTRFGHLHNLA